MTNVLDADMPQAPMEEAFGVLEVCLRQANAFQNYQVCTAACNKVSRCKAALAPAIVSATHSHHASLLTMRRGKLTFAMSSLQVISHLGPAHGHRVTPPRTLLSTTSMPCQHRRRLA